MQDPNIIKVGIGVMVFKDGKVLLGKRKSLLGKGDYAWPGGKLEFMESFEECAKREAKEEAGIEIKNVRFVRLMNWREKTLGKHFVDIEVMADWESGEPTVCEPDKCESWGWYDFDNLPEPLFAPMLSSIEAYKTGKNYFDD